MEVEVSTAEVQRRDWQSGERCWERQGGEAGSAGLVNKDMDNTSSQHREG